MKVLIVDDDSRDRAHLSQMVGAQGHEVMESSDGRDALSKLSAFRVDVMLTDLRMPGMNGLQLLKHLRAENALPPTIVLTAFGSVETALSVVHELGGFWFLEKPIEPNVLRVLLQRAGMQGRLEQENRELRRQLSFKGSMGELVGKSARMLQVYAMLRQAGPTGAPVLLTGESGTGKELAARAAHELSRRSGQPFVALNCAAVPETLMESEVFGHEKGSFTGAFERRAGCLELAEGGTLFLDELGEMPITMQAKLLRVLEDFRYRRIGGKTELVADVRIIAATNRPPADAIRQGKLREDLYYRLNVFTIELPPLRARMDDLPLLVEHLICRANQRHGVRVAGIQPEALDELRERKWEGNVRELRNVIERAVILTGAGLIGSHSLAPHYRGEVEQKQSPPTGLSPKTVSVPVGSPLDDAERMFIEATLSSFSNNKTRAAQVLGISTKTLHTKLRQYNNGKEGSEKT